MYTAKDEKGKQIALKLLQELAKSYKVYFVNGEHDCDEKFIQNLKDNEVNVLDYKKEAIAIKIQNKFIWYNKSVLFSNF